MHLRVQQQVLGAPGEPSAGLECLGQAGFVSLSLSFVHSFTHAFIHSFVYSFICSFFYSLLLLHQALTLVMARTDPPKAGFPSVRLDNAP